MPTAAEPIPLAVREYSATWTATAAIAVNTSPASTTAAPNTIEPSVGSFVPIRPAVVTTPTPTLVPIETMTAAYRPTTPEASSSARPLSSSARVCLVTVNTAIKPTISAMNPTSRHSVNPPTADRSNAGP